MKKEIKTVDCTPTWQGIYQYYIASILELSNIQNRTPEQDKALTSAKQELNRMAKIADAFNAMRKLITERDMVLIEYLMSYFTEDRSEDELPPKAVKIIKELYGKLDGYWENKNPSARDIIIEELSNYFEDIKGYIPAHD